jgi:hypothetical protein
LIRWNHITGECVETRVGLFGISNVIEVGDKLVVAEENGTLNVFDNTDLQEIEVPEDFQKAHNHDNDFPSRSRVVASQYADGLLKTGSLEGDVIIWDFDPDSVGSTKQKFKFNFGSTPRYIFSEDNITFILTAQNEVYAIDNESGEHKLRAKLLIAPRFVKYAKGSLVSISNEGGVRRYNLSEVD